MYEKAIRTVEELVFLEKCFVVKHYIERYDVAVWINLNSTCIVSTLSAKNKNPSCGRMTVVFFCCSVYVAIVKKLIIS